MRKDYTQPEIELIEFTLVDIITTSDLDEGLRPDPDVPTTKEDEGPRI